MERPIDRVPPQVRILPPKRRQGRTRQRFVVDGEARALPEEEELAPREVDRPLGHAAEDEAGRRLDVTA